MDSLAIQHFDSLASFGRDCEKAHVTGSAFYQGRELIHAWNMAQHGGSEAMVSKAEKLVKEFEEMISIENLMPRWEDRVAGYLPNVPRYISGLPDCMRMKVNVSNKRAPISIYVVVTSSAGCSESDLLNRGMAITALYLALSATRPVSLKLVSGLSGNGTSKNNNIVTVQLEEPIVLGEAAWALTAQQFARGLTYAWLHTALRAGGDWPRNISCGNRAERVASWKDALSANDDDTIFPHPFVGDPELRRPVAYCKEVLEAYVADR